MRKLGKDALANLKLDTSCQIDLGSSVTAVDSSNYKTNIVWGFNHDNPIQDDNTFRQQKSVVLDAIEADDSTTTKITFSFDYNNVKNEKLILQKRANGNNIVAVMAKDTQNGTSSSLITTQEKRKKITLIYIPYGIKELCPYCFSQTNIESINIPDSVTAMRRGVFCNCKTLKSVIVPDNVTFVGAFAFAYCDNLINVSLPNDLADQVGDQIFRECSNLTNVTLPSNLTYIPLMFFHSCKALAKINIPDSVTSIGNNAFGQCVSLTEIILPNGLENIDNNAFRGCSSLKDITIPNSVTSIGIESFIGCISLTSIKIPNSVTSIGNNAFAGCSSLKNITIDKAEGELDVSTAGWGNASITWLR